MDAQPNPTLSLPPLDDGGNIKWINCNTAILVVHGIGNQLPLETIDEFGRGLCERLGVVFGNGISLSHIVVPKDDGSGGVWMDNVLRIHNGDSPHTIDIYEYYWANYTEDKATWKDLNTWLQGVVKGARTFYEQNKAIGKAYEKISPFFHPRTGKFRATRYWLFLAAASKVFVTLDLLCRGFLSLLTKIPLFGSLAESLLKSYSGSWLQRFTNVIGDVVVYNAVDPKCKFYEVKRRILDGAVKALKYLIEKKESDNQLAYPSVIVAGHSLGSQVSYDAINRLNLLVNQGAITTYHGNGNCKLANHDGESISDQLRGYITFGSPLDKIVFFLREHIPAQAFIRQQMLAHFHGFKQRDLTLATNSGKQEVKNLLVRHLEGVKWRNYFDNRDYVSGGLDYFHGVTNVKCNFQSKKWTFTHSRYWSCREFYQDVTLQFLQPKEKQNRKVSLTSSLRTGVAP